MLHPTEKIEVMRSARQRVLLHTLVLFALLALLLLRYPQIVEFFAVRFLGGTEGDGGLYVWLVRAFVDDPWSALRLEAPAMYPYGLVRAWSDNFLLPSFASYVLVQAGLSLEQAYNAVVLAALVLNGFTTYLFALAMGASFLPALCTGAIISSSSYFLGNMGHPQLLYFFWIPLSWLPWIKGHLSFRMGLATGIILSATFFSAVYFVFFIAIGLCILSVRHLLLVRTPKGRSKLLFSAIGVVIGLLPILPFIQPYLLVKEFFGGRQLFEASYFSATGLSYLSYTHLHRVFPFSSAWTHPEATICIGYSVLISLLVSVWIYRSVPITILTVEILLLAVVSSIPTQGNASEWCICLGAWVVLITLLVTANKLPSSVKILTALGVPFFTLSLGPGGNSLKGEPAFAPFSLLFSAIPGFESIRASGRLGVIVLFSLAIGFALLLTKLSRPANSRRAKLVAFMLGTAALLEQQVRAFPFDSLLPAPQALLALKHKASVSATAILPLGQPHVGKEAESWTHFATNNTRYMNWFVGLPGHLVNGYSGQRTKVQELLSSSLAEAPTLKSIHTLSRICGLSHVVLLSPPGARALAPETLRESVSSFSQVFSSIQAFDDGSFLLDFTPLAIESAEKENPFFLSPHLTSRFSISGSNEGSVPCEVFPMAWLREGQMVTKFSLPSISVTPGRTTLFEKPGSLQKPRVAPEVISFRSTSCSVSASCLARAQDAERF